jgi:hypothetical protein
MEAKHSYPNKQTSEEEKWRMKPTFVHFCIKEFAA